jgi:hypothetical protein
LRASTPHILIKTAAYMHKNTLYKVHKVRVCGELPAQTFTNSKQKWTCNIEAFDRVTATNRSKKVFCRENDDSIISVRNHLFFQHHHHHQPHLLHYLFWTVPWSRRQRRPLYLNYATTTFSRLSASIIYSILHVTKVKE